MTEKPWVLPAEAASGYGGFEMPLFLLASPITTQRAPVAFKRKILMVLGLSSLLSLSSCRIAAPSATEGIGSLLLKGKKIIKSDFLQGGSWMSPSSASCTMCEIWCIFLAVLLPLSCPRIQAWSQVQGSPGEKADGCMWPGKCVWMASNQQWLRTAGCPCSAHLP